ncbi:MAG: RNA-binding protein [Desulfuromonas sp.]|nr:MAG: RNA-binding protein [Desulfuromonas sp.]
MQTFELNENDYIELCSLLKLIGITGSGGIAKMLIADGQVLVDGEIELRKRCKIRRGQTVECMEETIEVV